MVEGRFVNGLDVGGKEKERIKDDSLVFVWVNVWIRRLFFEFRKR